MTKCAFFDFDNTLARGDSVVPFLLYAVRKGKAPKRQLFRAAWGYLTQLGRPEKGSRAKEHTFSFIKGKSPEELDDLARDFFREEVTPRLFEDAIAELWQLKSSGHTVVVVSASADLYMHLLPEVLPVDAVLSTHCVTENGVYTGKVEANCKGEEKPGRIARWLAQNHLELDRENSCAYGDSFSDAPMLRLVQHPVLVNPGKKLAAAFSGARAVRWR